MIEEQAVVVGIEHDQALLEIIRSKPCGLCGQTRGCGVSLWGRLFGHRNNVFRADNHIGAKVGDAVVVGIDEQALLNGSLMIYGIPLFGLLAGAGLAVSFSGPSTARDAYAISGALAGLLLGLLWLRGHSAGAGLAASYRPIIVRLASTIEFRPGCKRGD